MDVSHQLVLGLLWNIELVLKIERPIGKGPIVLGGTGEPGFTGLVIHGSKGFYYDSIRGGGAFDLVSKVKVEMLYIHPDCGCHWVVTELQSDCCQRC